MNEIYGIDGKNYNISVIMQIILLFHQIRCKPIYHTINQNYFISLIKNFVHKYIE